MADIEAGVPCRDLHSSFSSPPGARNICHGVQNAGAWNGRRICIDVDSSWLCQTAATYVLAISHSAAGSSTPASSHPVPRSRSALPWRHNSISMRRPGRCRAGSGALEPRFVSGTRTSLFGLHMPVPADLYHLGPFRTIVFLQRKRGGSFRVVVLRRDLAGLFHSRQSENDTVCREVVDPLLRR